MKLGLGIFMPVLETAASLIIPEIVEQGFAQLRADVKPYAVYVLAPFKTELKEIAAKSGTKIDDKMAEEIYAELSEWATANGFPEFMKQADELIKVKAV